jgi:hypothetical protein
VLCRVVQSLSKGLGLGWLILLHVFGIHLCGKSMLYDMVHVIYRLLPP